MPYLDKQTLSDKTNSGIHEFSLPYDPETIVRVKEQPIARMNRYSEAVQVGGNRAKQESYALILDSIVDDNGDPIFESREQIAKSACRLVTALIKMIGQVNGGEDDDIEEMAKNLSETD